MIQYGCSKLTNAISWSEPNLNEYQRKRASGVTQFEAYVKRIYSLTAARFKWNSMPNRFQSSKSLIFNITPNLRSIYSVITTFILKKQKSNCLWSFKWNRSMASKFPYFPSWLLRIGKLGIDKREQRPQNLIWKLNQFVNKRGRFRHLDWN